MNNVEDLSKAILRELLADFTNRNLNADDLHMSYDGANLAAVKERCRSALSVSEVDFDLALKELEHGDLITTGPLVPFENKPNSSVFVAMLFSKYEHASLTVKGYKAAQQAQVRKTSKPSSQRVNISGSHFHNSQIGIGSHVEQSLTMTLSESPVFMDLRKAVETVGDAEDRAKILAGIDGMQSAVNKTELATRYAAFIAQAANHMTIISPFLPALAALLNHNFW